MATVGEARIDISASGAGQAKSALESVGGALTTVGTIAAGAAVAGLLAVGAAGFKSAATFEMMELSLQSLTAREILNAGATTSMAQAFDMAKGPAHELYGWVRQLAIQSPFSAEGVANAFRTAQAYGFTSEMTKRLTQATIDFASATGQSEAAMNSIALALGQIQAKGKLSAQEILQLTNVGVPALQYLSEHFGKTTAEIVKMMEKGLIPASEAVEAITKGMEEDFAGAAARSQNTLQGLMSTLGDLWEMSTAALFGELFKGFAPLAGQVSGWLQEKGLPLLTTLGEEAGKAADKISSTLMNAFFHLQAGWSPLMVLKQLFPQVFTPEVQAAIESIGGALARLGEALGPAAITFLQGLGDSLKGAFGETGPQIIENLTNAFTGLAVFFENNLPLFNSIGQVLGLAISSVVTWVSGLAAAIGQILAGDFSGALNSLGDTFMAFADSVSQAFGGVDFSTVLATWSNNFAMLGLIISTAAGNIVAAVTSTFQAAISAAAATAAGAVVAGVAFAESVVSGVSGTINNIVGLVTGAIQSAITAATTEAGKAGGVGAALATGIAGGIAGHVGNIIAAAVAAVQAAIAAAWKAADAHSPSRIMMKLGGFLSEGMALGITRQASDAVSAMSALTNATMQPAYATAGASPMSSPARQTNTTNHNYITIMAQSGDNLTDLMRQAEELQGD